MHQPYQWVILQATDPHPSRSSPAQAGVYILVPTTLSSHRFHPKILLFPLLWSSSYYSSRFFAFSFVHFVYAVLYPSNFSFPLIDPLFSFYFGLFSLFLIILYTFILSNAISWYSQIFSPIIYQHIKISESRRERDRGRRPPSQPPEGSGWPHYYTRHRDNPAQWCQDRGPLQQSWLMYLYSGLRGFILFFSHQFFTPSPGGGGGGIFQYQC